MSFFDSVSTSLSRSSARSSAWLLAAFLGVASAGAQNATTEEAATAASALQVLPGFRAELLYTVPRTQQGSWVSLTVDHRGRLIAGDQYGGLYRITVPPPNSSEGTRVEALNARIGGAHGLLYAFDSLYVMVNERSPELPGGPHEGRPPRSGLWRLRDTDGDDQFDEIRLLREIRGFGEHGPHALVLSPDGKSIYFANGNHTALPTDMEKSRLVSWDEDHLLPRMWDARGHARNIFAPGGYVARTDPEGREIELFSIGFRNQYDIAFDQNGELFTFDSDMEWDQGTSWYMPTRINHVVSGSDFGWRSGAGRWPAYYADSLPGVLDVGPGSPTGVVFGTGAKFPAKYQNALYAADWTYGTLYAIHLEPDGATFRGKKEEFVSGKPLPLTDLVIHPGDGAMYFAVGGRRTQSALYRIRYVGTESTVPARPAPPTPEARLRRSLEALHDYGVGRAAIDTAWPHLDHPDRFVRFAARVAIEKQPAALWAERALTETRPRAAVEALIALARLGDPALQPRLLDALSRLPWARQPAEIHLPALRAWQLAFTRMGRPNAEVRAQLAAQLDPLFPQADAFVNRELAALLIYLESPRIVGKLVPLLSVSEPAVAIEEVGEDTLLARNERYGTVASAVGSSRPDRQQIAYAYLLRNATAGWTKDLRLAYFSWFNRTRSWRGGMSFDGFIENIRTEALANAVSDPAERSALDSVSRRPAAKILADVVTPKGPGRDYTVDEALALTQGQLQKRDFLQGQAMFGATACAVCHRFNNEGGGIGPDISGAGSRYTLRDLLENIIEPSKVISDQYASEQIETTSGTFVGRVVGEEAGHLLVMTNAFAPDEQTRVPVASVRSRQPFDISLMPPGLINALNPDELRDLLAYLLSGGNPQDPMFKR